MAMTFPRPDAEIPVETHPLPTRAIAGPVRWLLAGGGVLAALASVWLATTGYVAGHATAAALSAALATALWTPALARALPRPAATVMAAAVIGLFALANEPALSLWTIPQHLRELVLLTDVSAGCFTAVYLLAFMAVLAGSARPLRLPTSCGLLAMPFVFNLLLVLDARDLMTRIGARLGAAPDYAPWLARGVTLWVFNLAVVIGVAWVIDHRGTRSARIHGLLLLAASAALLTPLIADFGSSASVAAWPPVPRLLAVLATGATAQAGLWAEVFLLTGVLLDALRGRRPTPRSCRHHWQYGLVRGAIFGALYMLLTHVAVASSHWLWLTRQLHSHPLAGGAVVGALLFPFARTLFESFDGSDPFFRRLGRVYANPANSLRGILVGAVLVAAVQAGLPEWSEGRRFLVGFGIGALGYGGADLLRDRYAMLRGRRQRLQTPRLYGLGVLLGGLVGGALAWYFDEAQLGTVVTKFFEYAEVSVAASGSHAKTYVVYPLFSKWGAIDLGSIGGGVRLFWSESMAGVINWAIAAPLFGVNLVLLTALVQRSFAPLRTLFSREGLVGVFAQTIRVLRWGPWMAPIIFTFLRLAPLPTWYNQDGLVHTLVAIGQRTGLSSHDFQLWSLQCFLGLLAYDWLRILIWFDHMGLRVATLVNFSFVGADALDEKAAHALGHSARTRIVPEGIRRFFTWAPLLIPFYLPRGANWDYVWSEAQAMTSRAGTPLLPAVGVLVIGYGVAGLATLVLVAAIFAVRRRLGLHTPPRAPSAFAYRLSNGQYTLDLNPDGSGYSHVQSSLRSRFEIDLTRRPDDSLQLRGKWFWLRELREGAAHGEPWSLTALPSGQPLMRYRVRQPQPSRLCFEAERGDLHTELDVSIADGLDLEVWNLRLHNASDRARRFEITSYRELAMATSNDYRRAPSFAALHVGTCFVRPLGALLAHGHLLCDRRKRSSPETAFHAVHADGEHVQLLGYEDSRTGFIGCGTLRRPAVFDGRALRSPDDEGHLYTFDPIASLRVAIWVPARGSAAVRFVDGYAKDAQSAAGLIARAFSQAVPDADGLKVRLDRTRSLRQFDTVPHENAFSADGTEVHAPPDAARPWSHVLANPQHGAVIGADGGVFSFHANSQQNALTPFALEALPTQRPGQLFGVVDLDSGDRFSAALIPWRRADATREVVFGLGYVRFRARHPGLELEETVVVPPDAPLLLRTLRIRNTGPAPRRLRVVAYAQMVLAEVAFDSIGRIEVRETADKGVLLFRNANNDYHKGWAFVATGLSNPVHETVRTRFLGGACEVGDAWFVVHGSGDRTRQDDGRRCAAFAERVEVAPGEERCVSFVIGQDDDPESALGWARRFRDADASGVVRSTRTWWQRHLGGLQVETDRAEFDRLVNTWLPYQIFCARLWARCGPQQRSGAIGFRDQLQDVLPLIVSHPEVARRQVLLHAAQQFREGDVLFWWHSSWEGRTGLAARSAASDPHLWLPYVAARYVHATGDHAMLREDLRFLEGRALPRGVGGIVFAPRTSKDHGTLYEHCRRALDYALARRSPRGLPLIRGGDWNDSLDALGLGGRGESGWLGLFLHRVLVDFAPIAEGQGDAACAQRYRTAAVQLRGALEQIWHDSGYARATNDKSEALRFADSLMAAWPALSQAVAENRARTALELGLQALERERRVLLLTPPFGVSAKPYPGRIAQYPPGVRENGGQYSHGASWTVDAWLRLAHCAAERGDHTDAAHCHRRAWELWWKISPLSKADPAYGLPPHQQPADVYDGPGYQGRGGWAWYTGAAARMLEAAYGLLGLEMRDGELHLNRASEDATAPRLRRLVWQGREIEVPK